jgi:ribosomal protein S18 acetylase RimI-like enzyme
MKVTLTANELTAEALYAMFHATMETYVNLARGSAWDDVRERAQFLEQTSMASVRLIRADEEVVGFVDFRIHEHSCNLHTMVVIPNWQSNGIGSSVLELLMESSRELTLSVLKSNPRARSLYERKGFREVSSTQHHHHMAWTSNNSESGALKTARSS